MVGCSTAAGAGDCRPAGAERAREWEGEAWVVVAETEAVEGEDRSLAEAEAAEDRRRKTRAAEALGDPEEWYAAEMATEKQAFLEPKRPQTSQTLSE